MWRERSPFYRPRSGPLRSASGRACWLTSRRSSRPRRTASRHSRPAPVVYGELLELHRFLLRLRGAEERKPPLPDRRLVRAAAGGASVPRPAPKQVLREIVTDLARRSRAAACRGDVGSGKLSSPRSLVVAVSGLQGTFMAPTELLANPALRNLSRLSDLTASPASAPPGAIRRRAALSRGEIPDRRRHHALLRADRLRASGWRSTNSTGSGSNSASSSARGAPDLLVMTAAPIRARSPDDLRRPRDLLSRRAAARRTPIATEVLPAVSGARSIAKAAPESPAAAGRISSSP